MESKNLLKCTKQLDTAHRLVSRYGELLMWKHAEFDGFMVSVRIYSKSKKRKIRIGLCRCFFPEDMTVAEKKLLEEHSGISIPLI